ncbi:MAG: hypothetical protein Q4F84_10495 [Fibrobacter sp.]|nr:hypothetical protein [Fibrobacter sp.]
MKRLAFLVLFLASCAYSQYTTTISGGLALGFEKCHTNPGVFASIETGVKLHKYFQIGGHIEYGWLTIEKDFLGEYVDKGGYHVFDIGVVPKLCLPLNEDVSFTFEVDPAYTLFIAYIKSADFMSAGSGSDAMSGFILTYCFGISINSFYMAYKIKSPFVKTKYSDELIDFDMMSISVGFKVGN